MAQTTTIDMKTIARGGVLGIKLINARQFRWRVKIAKILFSLGARVMWMDVECERMEWTTNKPTEEGFYWVRGRGSSEASMVKIVERGGWLPDPGLEVDQPGISEARSDRLDNDYGAYDDVEWWGPLASPESETPNG